MIHRHGWLIAGLWLAATVSMGGCGDAIEPIGPGNLQVEWNVAARGCQANDVQRVALSIRRDGDMFEKAEFSCDARMTMFEDVPRDEYQLHAVGLGPAGEHRFESESRRVIVEGDDVTEFVSLRLSALPATATVRWHFANAQLCGSNGARYVRAILFGAEGFAAWDAERKCSVGELQVPSVPPGTYDLVVRAVDNQGATQADGAVEVMFEPGGAHDVTVEMTPVSSGE